MLPVHFNSFLLSLFYNFFRRLMLTCVFYYCFSMLYTFSENVFSFFLLLTLFRALQLLFYLFYQKHADTKKVQHWTENFFSKSSFLVSAKGYEYSQKNKTGKFLLLLIMFPDVVKWRRKGSFCKLLGFYISDFKKTLFSNSFNFQISRLAIFFTHENS